MNTIDRAHNYRRNGGQLTPAQRRRMIKKAGREPGAIIIREDGMGFARARQGEKLLIGFEDPRPVSAPPASAEDVETVLDAE